MASLLRKSSNLFIRNQPVPHDSNQNVVFRAVAAESLTNKLENKAKSREEKIISHRPKQ